jgi:hypothetical protein
MWINVIYIYINIVALKTEEATNDTSMQQDAEI